MNKQMWKEKGYDKIISELKEIIRIKKERIIRCKLELENTPKINFGQERYYLKNRTKVLEKEINECKIEIDTIYNMTIG